MYQSTRNELETLPGNKRQMIIQLHWLELWCIITVRSDAVGYTQRSPVRMNTARITLIFLHYYGNNLVNVN